MTTTAGKGLRIIVDETEQFARIARAAHQRMVKHMELARRLALPSDGDEPLPARFPRQVSETEAAAREAFTTVVFAAISLESFINAHGAMHLGARHFSNYLERIDAVAKWILVPKLTKQFSFPADSHMFGGLKKLYAARNKLAHPKTRQVVVSPEMDWDYSPWADADAAIATLDAIAQALGATGRALL